MPLADYAREVAAERNGERNQYLSRLAAIDAVIACAFQAGTLDQPQADRLWDMDWWDNFSAFVGPDDQLVLNQFDLASLPAGNFLAFIEVDEPESGKTEGRRHLLHAMISLGEGLAAGCRNDLIEQPQDGDAWQILDFAGGLKWLGEHNGFDAIEAMPLGIAKSRRLRLRCRAPDQAPRRVAAPTTGAQVWGNPRPSRALADRIVAAAARTLRDFKAPASWDSPHPEPIYRPTFKFRISRDDYEEFFNSPNELRGHYYTSAELGDQYTASLMQRLAGEIDWAPLLSELADIFTSPLTALKQSLERGKIWTAEDSAIIVEEPAWNVGQATDRDGHRIIIPPNHRWRIARPRNDGNWQAFWHETGMWRNDLPDDVRATAITELSNRFRLGGRYAAIQGANYFYTRTVPRLPRDDVENLPNIDVKGGWTKADGSDGEFTPPKKFFRGHQIKWFGFT